jgi:hypothetical protein
MLCLLSGATRVTAQIADDTTRSGTPHGRMAHGPREPKLLMDVTPRILDWSDRHLGRVDTSE